MSIGKTLFSLGEFKVVTQKSLDYNKPDLNFITMNDDPILYLRDLDDCKDVCNVLSVYHNKIKKLEKENTKLEKEIETLQQTSLYKHQQINNELIKKVNSLQKTLTVVSENYTATISPIHLDGESNIMLQAYLSNLKYIEWSVH